MFSFVVLQSDGNLVVKEGIMPGDDTGLPVKHPWYLASIGSRF
jgi:hypothetical protein